MPEAYWFQGSYCTSKSSSCKFPVWCPSTFPISAPCDTSKGKGISSHKGPPSVHFDLENLTAEPSPIAFKVNSKVLFPQKLPQSHLEFRLGHGREEDRRWQWLWTSLVNKVDGGEEDITSKVAIFLSLTVSDRFSTTEIIARMFDMKWGVSGKEFT